MSEPRAGTTLAKLVEVSGIEAKIAGDPSTVVTDLAFDSRAVTEGALFLCVRGARTDGHLHAPEAARGGAAALVADRATEVDLPTIMVDDVRAAM
ncbi:MAG: Mur ligase domain-containing protein, partial [Actinomycetota bacterium]